MGDSCASVSSLSSLGSHGRARLGDAPPPLCVGVLGNSTFRAFTPQGTPGTRAPPRDAGYSTLQPVTPLRTDAPCLGQRLALELFLAVADRHRGDRLGAARNNADAAVLADHLGPDATTQRLNKECNTQRGNMQQYNMLRGNMQQYNTTRAIHHGTCRQQHATQSTIAPTASRSTLRRSAMPQDRPPTLVRSIRADHKL